MAVSPQAKKRSRAPNRRIAPILPSWESGPFLGMRDATEIKSARPKLASFLGNVMPINAQLGQAWVGRPGLRVFQEVGGKGQQVFQFDKLDGTQRSLAFIAGEIYEMDWTLRTVTKRISTAQLAGASITLSSTARISCVVLADVLVVSDGVNTPFTWDGTAGAGLVELTAAPVFYGQLTTYYGKVFGIKASDRSRLCWSEENDPTTGYSGTNEWQLGQTDQNALSLLVGTNEQLLVLRERSATAITGAVTPDFQSSGTREGLSDTIGTASPWSAVHVQDEDGNTRYVYFMDADLRAHAWTPGAGLAERWHDYQETLSGLDRAYVADVIGLYDPATRLALHGVVGANATVPNQLLTLNPDINGGQASGVWSGFEFTAAGILTNQYGRKVLVHLTEDGFIYDHGLPHGLGATADEQVWDDEFDGGTVAIEHEVQGSFSSTELRWEAYCEQMIFSFRAESGMTDMAFNVETPHGLSATQTVSVVSEGQALWGYALWGVGLWSSPRLDARVVVGTNALGRWFRYSWRHAVVGEQFGFNFAVSGTLVEQGDHPQVP